MTSSDPQSPWFGTHLLIRDDQDLALVHEHVPALAAVGMNSLILEVNYHFEFDSQPELRSRRLVTRRAAAALAERLRSHGIRPIPMLNCLGHQSWKDDTFALLTVHPELDETPGAYPGNDGIYCREWCPRHPEVHRIVFPLMDELIDAFGADAFHVGLDEVFLLGAPQCPRCRGADPAELFAGEVLALHDHLNQRRADMLMWADRLLDAAATGYGSWEASANGTHPAVDSIPKDIVLCDWHYEVRDEYPSIAHLLDKGFRVWPAGWRNAQATTALIAAAHRAEHPRMLGHLCTTWGAVGPAEVADWPPVQAARGALGLDR